MAVSLTSLHSFTASIAFRLLAALLGLAVLTSIWIFFQLDADALHVSSLLRQHQEESQAPPPHLFPRLPYLPAFPSLGDNPEQVQDLIDQTLHANTPTIAGIAAILYAFLQDLHASHKHIAQSERSAYNFDDIRASYVRLVQKHLVPLDAAYRTHPIFPIRHDDSVFVSVAAFREHLLADTLASMFASAAHPEKLFVGVVVINCFGFEGEYPCQGSAKVVGKDKNGKDVLDIQDGRPDINHIESFCQNVTFQPYCEGGQVRVLYVNETDALGPAVTRYFTSKLWGGETYYVQVDSHLRFANRWDELYIADLKLTTSYPKSVLSTYPPGFVNFRQDPPFTPGTRLCRCQIRPEEEFLPRIEMEGRCREDEVRPTQMAFIGAGFFFARAEFLVDVPFDPFLPHLFMGEEVALSVRAWTHGWNIFAPRKNLIGHQYRPVRVFEYVCLLR